MNTQQSNSKDRLSRLAERGRKTAKISATIIDVTSCGRETYRSVKLSHLRKCLQRKGLKIHPVLTPPRACTSKELIILLYIYYILSKIALTWMVGQFDLKFVTCCGRRTYDFRAFKHICNLLRQNELGQRLLQDSQVLAAERLTKVHFCTFRKSLQKNDLQKGVGGSGDITQSPISAHPPVLQECNVSNSLQEKDL